MSELHEIGRNIVLLRKAQRMTQEQVAFQAGISVSRLQDIEYGCQNTTVDTLICIAETLHVSPIILAIFTKKDQEILSSICSLPRLAEEPIRALQFCKNIALLRKKKGLTQQQFARMVNISISHLRDIEHGCANATYNRLARIANGFNLSLLQLHMMTGSDAMLLAMLHHARVMAEIL